MIKAHRRWIVILLGAIFLHVSAAPLESHFVKKTTEKVSRLQEEKEQLVLQIRQWEADAMTAAELSDSIEAKEIEKFLAPSNRAFLAERLELMAAAARLYNFTFSLAPATPWAGDKDFPNFHDIEQSHLSFEAEAPYDAALFRFFDALSEMTGRIEVERVTIQRLKNNVLSAHNLQIKGDIFWLSNSEKRKRP